MIHEIEYRMMRKNSMTGELTSSGFSYFTDKDEAVETLNRERVLSPEYHYVLVTRLVTRSDWERTDY